MSGEKYTQPEGLGLGDIHEEGKGRDMRHALQDALLPWARGMIDAGVEPNDILNALLGSWITLSHEGGIHPDALSEALADHAARMREIYGQLDLANSDMEGSA